MSKIEINKFPPKFKKEPVQFKIEITDKKMIVHKLDEMLDEEMKENEYIIEELQRYHHKLLDKINYWRCQTHDEMMKI